ncbi:CDP-glycerol glycerophosphotransferase family protein [Lacisediminihabitans changchengi]|uniref:CDP-glycerol glycerophosphotransferase family protein n=1 Tax=Lacisediminihabitans changchengi TaxID=2787634 RepID=A0A934SL71_9MICO|nr:CDP-glycerol glycerophosphotransferase family protein [Lacisediminihabitans changchengi]MBK4347380.1 CDP-glycerol glycerophosphotransferase family protein [Lacisediminihabitans changchengi]
MTTIDTLGVQTEPSPAILLGGPGTAPQHLTLAGTRQQLVGAVTDAGDRWSATIPLLSAHWKSAPMPPRSGRYTLGGAVGGVVDAVELAADLPASQLIEGVTRISFGHDDGSLTVDFAAPLTDRERGRLQQASLEADYRATDYAPIDAVFFESFFGRNASCNPLAIDRSFALQRPDIQRYWSVADASVTVPDGAIALVEGSAEWWRIRGSARLLVVNDWLRKRYRKRKHQTVLQTWHGTMLKKLALSRGRVGLRTTIATILESRRWDILLAQNDYSRRIFRKAYAFLGPVWEVGYPRDDVLLTGDAATVRDRLGIPNDTKVLLYAPTWRDDHPDQVDHLDVAAFARELGPDYVTLIRGHSRTLLPGEDVRATGVIDVTGYPDVSELFLVADALITDYSSVMFDFTVTGKPIFFFTPDLEHYRSTLRGFYFDLLPVAPGPVIADATELARRVRETADVPPEFRERYAAWQARFNPRDDGHAADRVVARLVAEGIVG